MRRPNTKKAFAAMTFISLAFGATLTYGLMLKHSANAKSAHSQPNITAAASSLTRINKTENATN